MSALRFRPEFGRVPWQALAGFAAAVYVLRSILRGWDFRPNLLDLVVFGAFALILLARPLMVKLLGGGEEPEHADGDGTDDSEGTSNT